MMQYPWAIANLGLLVCVACGSSGGTDAKTSAGGSTSVIATGGNSSAQTSAGGSTATAATGGNSSAQTSAGGSTATTATGGNSSGTVGGTSSATVGGTTAASTGGASGQLDCTRSGLQLAVDKYVAALQARDTSLMPLASSLTYTEIGSDGTISKIADGLIWQTALPVEFNRSWLDTTGCEAYTEVFITGGGHPYVLGTRLKVTGSQISEVYTLVTDSGDWNFDAAAYSTCSQSEDWSTIPADKQSSREALIAAASSYFTYFADPNKDASVVPWGNPCYRLEGGKGCTPAGDKGSTNCNVGITQTVSFAAPHFVVDVDLGTAVAMTRMGGTYGLPDSHLFRLTNGTIRYIHTLTICTTTNCGT